MGSTDMALTGDLDRADSLAQELHERFSLHRPLNSVSLPTIYATIELQRGNPQKALEILRPALPLDFCEFSSLAAVYIRAKPSFVWATAKTLPLNSERSLITRESWPPLNATRWHISDSPEPWIYKKILAERAPSIKSFLRRGQMPIQISQHSPRPRANTSG